MPLRKNHTFSHQQNIWFIKNYGEFKSLTALRWEFLINFKLSPRQLPHSSTFSRVTNRFMASGGVSPSKLPGSPPTKIIDEYIHTVRYLVEEKPNSSISDVSIAMNLSTVLCGRFCGKHWENIHINLKLFKGLPISTNCVEGNFQLDFTAKLRIPQ